MTKAQEFDGEIPQEDQTYEAEIAIAEGVEDDAANDVQVKTIQYDVSSYGADYDVDGLVKRLDRGDILVPSFQRSYVWKIKEASKFIESLLLGLPVPGVFFAKESDSNRLLVIDGQQRLKSLSFFKNGVFNPKKEEKKQKVFRLTGVQERFDGLKYEDLNDSDRIKLDDSIIHATIIKQESPRDDNTAIYYVFDRLNSYGRKLTAQEIRTAIDHGALINLLKTLNTEQAWREVYGVASDRLKDQELILRFLALYKNSEMYERPMNEFLNKFSKMHRNSPAEFLSESGEVFINAIRVVQQAVGNRAFRPLKALNAAVYDSVMVGLAKRLANGPINNLAALNEAYNFLLLDKEYLRLVSSSTADNENVKNRIKKATEQFSNLQ